MACHALVSVKMLAHAFVSSKDHNKLDSLCSLKEVTGGINNMMVHMLVSTFAFE